MAQTQDAISGACGTVEVSVDGSTWVNISGSANSVQEVAQNRQTGEVYTLDGDVAIITRGKREPITAEVRIVYTEQAGEAFETVRPIFEEECGGDLWVRWSPQGIGAAGRFVFTAERASITNFKYNNVAADDAAPIMAGFTFKVAQVIKTTTATSTGLGS